MKFSGWLTWKFFFFEILDDGTRTRNLVRDAKKEYNSES